MALKYDLDRLGWYEFEGLVQALLKRVLGMGVEAWGGQGDWGRDAYFSGSLKYPSKSMTGGPFLFQCKFVNGANAAGAQSDAAVLAAIKRECGRISARLGGGKIPASRAKKEDIWAKAPSHYGFFTNARLGRGLRTAIDAELNAVLSSSQVHQHDGRDICAWLDNARAIARAYPQILGLADLEQLLSQWANRDIVRRSETALLEAKEISPVFVPTGAYELALKTLSKHGFVVLEGPPEMGKTAIGRMIALANLARGWQVVECKDPADFLKEFKAASSQIFIADDFFGRTEYDPARISKWQDDLPHILRRLDNKHWLVLTTRAHLLNLAKSDLDISGAIQSFPDLGEVVVNAGDLSNSEKARMLYRHGKAVQLTTEMRQAVKGSAVKIVGDTHFTPERIRRLCQELTTKPAELLKGREIGELIKDSLANPTKGMRLSFDKLPGCHRWMLYSLVEAGQGVGHHLWWLGPDSDTLKEIYQRLCPREIIEPFARVSSELSEAFVRRLGMTATESHIDWIHPSCRDLAIDKLVEDQNERQHFLSNCGVAGLKLATSTGGGPKGDRVFPLLVDDQDWRDFSERSAKLITSGVDVLSDLQRNYEVAKKSKIAANKLSRLEKILNEDLLSLAVNERSKWGQWNANSLKTYYAIASGKNRSATPPPELCETISKSISHTLMRMKKNRIWDEATAMYSLAQLIDVARENKSAELNGTKVTASIDKLVAAILGSNATEDIEDLIEEDLSADEKEGLIDGFQNASKSLKIMQKAFPHLDVDGRGDALGEIADFANDAADTLERERRSEDDPDEEDDGDHSRSSAEFDIGQLFADF